METNTALIEYLKRAFYRNFPSKYIDQRVFDAMISVDRIDFLPPNVRDYAYFDEALSIGYKQTCSQPSIVALMLNEIAIEPGNTVLEIGSGSGYAAAIASKLSGASGMVYACEIVPELATQMKLNIGHSFNNIIIIEKDGSKGFPEFAPFDRIFLSAGVNIRRFNRDILLRQLATPGILVYPEARGRLFKVLKLENRIDETSYSGVSFVPLKGENA